MPYFQKKYDNVCKNLDKLQEVRDEKCEKIRELLKKLPEIANTLSGAVRRSKNRSPNIQYLLKPLSNDDFYRTLPPSSGAARDLLCDNIARYEGLDGDHTDVKYPMMLLISYNHLYYKYCAFF